MATLLQLSANACAAALAISDPRVVADVGDLPRELVELVALSYFKFKLLLGVSRDEKQKPSALPLPTSSNHIPALRALAESDALSPSLLILSDAARTLSRGAFLYLNLASHSLVHLEIHGCDWLDSLDFVSELPSLRCLSLRGCVALPSHSLDALARPPENDEAHAPPRRRGRGRPELAGNCAGARRPPNLVSLNLSGCAAVDDAAGPHLARLPRSMRSLDLSTCAVGNLLLDYLTYRGRLTRWRRDRRGIGHRENSCEENGRKTSDEDDGCLRLRDLRLRGTRVSDAGLGHLKTLGPDVALLDLSECRGVSGAAMADLASLLGMSASASRPGTLVAPGTEEDVRETCACGSGRESCDELAEEGWRAFLCAVREEEIREEEIREEEIREEEIREEEIREESRRVAALAESERDEPDAVEDDGNILMFPIGAPLSHSHPNGGESPPHQYRRVSYLID